MSLLPTGHSRQKKFLKCLNIKKIHKVEQNKQFQQYELIVSNANSFLTINGYAGYAGI